MELIPAIDILEGRVVRLQQGRYDQVTVYAEEPVEQAKRFFQEGAKRLHVVDLDGARTGRPVNIQTIKGILAATTLRIELGGGIRDRATAERWYDSGVERVVLGTAAIRNPDLVRQLCAEHPDGVVVAVDSRRGEVAVEGWQQASGRSEHDLARQADAWGVAAILYTVIERDGMSVGPEVAATLALQQQVRATVIASGGIATLEDIVELARGGVRAAVCGRALYSGAFSLRQALETAGAA